MKQVFVAPHVTEAELVKALLANEGIEATVRNEELFSVVTEMVQPTVWVDDGDGERAKAFVQAYLRKRPATGASVLRRYHFFHAIKPG